VTHNARVSDIPLPGISPKPNHKFNPKSNPNSNPTNPTTNS